jgi:hypothetical protein
VKERRNAMPSIISFGAGTLGVAVTLWLAWIALTSDAVPVVGTARGALIAMAVVGMAACAIAGIGQAPVIGWTHPISIIGSVFGVVAIVLVAAGLFGWDGLVRPVASFVPSTATLELTTERLAIVALAAVVAVKWVVGVALEVLIQTRA